MMHANIFLLRAALLNLVALLPLAVASAADEKPQGELGREAEAAAQKGIDHLRTKGQTDDGAFTPTIGPGFLAKASG